MASEVALRRYYGSEIAPSLIEIDPPTRFRSLVRTLEPIFSGQTPLTPRCRFLDYDAVEPRPLRQRS